MYFFSYHLHCIYFLSILNNFFLNLRGWQGIYKMKNDKNKNGKRNKHTVTVTRASFLVGY